MRTLLRLITVVGLVAGGAGWARAQDASAMAMQAAQTANDMAMQASQQANAMAMQAAQTANQNAMQASIDSSMWIAPPRPPLPITPRPMISKLKSGMSVALYDVDPKAIVFFTLDGSLPTPRSLRYTGPIAVRAKVRVRAMAFDLEDLPSGVVSKTVRAGS